MAIVTAIESRKRGAEKNGMTPGSLWQIGDYYQDMGYPGRLQWLESPVSAAWGEDESGNRWVLYGSVYGETVQYFAQGWDDTVLRRAISTVTGRSWRQDF